MVDTSPPDTRVIDLSEPRNQDDFPDYVAIYSTRASGPFVLSPEAMRWSDEIFLVKLESCRNFWLTQKKKLRCRLVDIFDPLLRHHYGDDYIAVFGKHPWQCLLFLYYQLKHDAAGLYLLQSRLNQNIYRTLDWQSWFGAQRQLADHFIETKARGFRAESFRSRQARMQRFIDRIGIASPGQMSDADANSIQRRFGKWLGLVWRWSFSDSSALQDFPWVNLRPQALPQVKRELEYPVNDWSHIEVLLREDFACLSGQFRQPDCEHVNRMDWEITLFNDQKISVELSFRHPYSLRNDMPAFATALYQARYLYDDLMRKLQQRESDLDLPESMPFIGWRIEVCERILLAPQLWDLFARDNEDVDYQQVMNLQNKLPLAFECYQSDPGFYPEQSFISQAPGESVLPAADTYLWSCAASNKPLFFYPVVQAIEPPLTAKRIFLERNASQWWLGQDALQSLRDYFIVKDQRGRLSWAYRNQDGAWFKQGEYC